MKSHPITRDVFFLSPRGQCRPGTADNLLLPDARSVIIGSRCYYQLFSQWLAVLTLIPAIALRRLT
ncbi:MAG: hypothetical protein ABGZ24_14630, partial [Fuerstiella sp.]